MMALPPRQTTRSGSSPKGWGWPAGQSATRITWFAARTKQRPSWAMWRIVVRWLSQPSAVGAQYSSMPWSYIAIRAAGIRFSQQITAPNRPKGVS